MLDNAVNPLEFYDKLVRQRDAKRQELQIRFENLGGFAVREAGLLEPDPKAARWHVLRRFVRHALFDWLVKLLAALTPDVDVFHCALDPDSMDSPQPRATLTPENVFNRDEMPDAVRTMTPPASTSPSPPTTPTRPSPRTRFFSTHFDLYPDIKEQGADTIEIGEGQEEADTQRRVGLDLTGSLS